MDTLLCDQCGEVEMDGEGAVVGGSFYELDGDEDEDPDGIFGLEYEPRFLENDDLRGGREDFGRWAEDEE
jgi:hypothetical protein